jgi:hypothetical protein
MHEGKDMKFSSNNALTEGITGHDGWLKYGERLLSESIENGGFSEWFDDARDIDAMCRAPGSRVNSDHIKAATAVLMENERRAMEAMDETTRSLTLAGFQDYLFPMIRMTFPSNPALDLVGVQPMTRRVGQIFYQHYKIGSNKGSYTAGSRVFDAQAGYAGGYHYTDEYVEDETLVASWAAATTVDSGVLTLKWGGAGGNGIRPGTVVITGVDKDTSSTVVIRDNSNGKFFQEEGNETILDAASANCYINYQTQQLRLIFDANDGFAAGAVRVSYEFDGEGSSNLPEIDIEIASSPVTARRRAMRMKFSAESAQDFSAEFGMSVEESLTNGLSGLITTEQARQIIGDLWEAAGAPYASFNLNFNPASAGYSRREYFTDIQYPMAQTINRIYEETQRLRANWMVVDVGMQNVLNTIGAPHFTKWHEAPRQTNMGIQFLGTWGDDVRVYVDSLLNRYPGASPTGNALFGYKGDDWMDVGYVWAPYRVLYTTPGITLEDFITRKGFASRTARKVVNARFYRRFELTNS